MMFKLDPDDPNAYVVRAELMNLIGRPGEAVKLVERALATNPPEIAFPLQVACQAHLLAGQAEQAIATCEKATGTHLSWWIHVPLVAAYANHGDMEKAAAAKAEVLRSAGYTISRLRAQRISDHPEYVKLFEQYWVAGLRKAGFAEK